MPFSSSNQHYYQAKVYFLYFFPHSYTITLIENRHYSAYSSIDCQTLFTLNKDRHIKATHVDGHNQQGISDSIQMLNLAYHLRLRYIFHVPAMQIHNNWEKHQYDASCLFVQSFPMRAICCLVFQLSYNIILKH